MNQNGLKSMNQAMKEEGGKEEREEHGEHYKHNSKNESWRTRGRKGHHSHLINSDSTRVIDLSLSQAPKGRETLTRMKENTNGGGAGDRVSLLLFNRAII
jgi:hypothetical protein